MIDLPEDVLRHIALNLSAPDILSFLCIHKNVNKSLAKSEALWNALLLRDSPDDEKLPTTYCGARQAFMIQAYRCHLPAVKWHHLRRTYQHGASAREGHLACVYQFPNEKRICVTGGFTDDQFIHLAHIPNGVEKDGSCKPWTWSRLRPEGQETAFVYGASLTPLDDPCDSLKASKCHVRRAVRFGGFQAGGYSQETNQVAVLSLKDELTEHGNTRLSASWEVVLTQRPQFARPRAYHTATLVAGRFLLILGGMMHRGSMMEEAILDTHTWAWLDRPIASAAEKPSGRHGHSVIFDSHRNRLLLFGGGSGSDLLRSGQDNAEVWELKMGKNWETDLLGSLPWQWSRIHDNPGQESDDDSERNNESETVPMNNDTASLTPAETLCLGRCHAGLKTSRDSALFVFGSGHPSTNGIIAYDLRMDTFTRPRVQGPLPKPRFTFGSALLETEGYLFVHGGYTSQESGTIGDMSILDLAPELNRKFDALPVDSNRRCYGAITNEEVRRARRPTRDAMMHRMLEALTTAPADERQAMASHMLGQLIASGEIGGQYFRLMNMIANGAATLQRADDEEDGLSDTGSWSD